jgi:uncharacterized small protein (DUF1192 family)
MAPALEFDEGNATMALFDEEIPRKTIHEIGSDLSLLSVEELTERIATLAEEIKRLEAEKGRKTESRSAAEQFFR